MSIWLTSDTHFNHENILKYEPASRPFDNIADMNEYMIAKWNERISSEDEVYHLGDFFMGDPDRIMPILRRLKGKITLIRGNHDSPNRLTLYSSVGIEVKDIAYLSFKGLFFILCHFPIFSTEFVDMVRADNRETVILYGHIHSNAPKGFCNGMYHVGVDTNELCPVSLQQIWLECHDSKSNNAAEISFNCLNANAESDKYCDGEMS